MVQDNNSVVQVHKVTKGENLTKISIQYRMALKELLDHNREIKDPNRISIGQEIYVVPGKPSVPVSQQVVDPIFSKPRAELVSLMAKQNGNAITYYVMPKDEQIGDRVNDAMNLKIEQYPGLMTDVRATPATLLMKKAVEKAVADINMQMKGRLQLRPAASQKSADIVIVASTKPVTPDTIGGMVSKGGDVLVLSPWAFRSNSTWEAGAAERLLLEALGMKTPDGKVACKDTVMAEYTKCGDGKTLPASGLTKHDLAALGELYPLVIPVGAVADAGHGLTAARKPVAHMAAMK